MDDLIKRIETLSDNEIQDVIPALSKRFSAIHPDMDMTVLALHTDPVLRQEEYDFFMAMAKRELEWRRQDQALLERGLTLPF